MSQVRALVVQRKIIVPIAQMVEQQTFNLRVDGSSPSGGTLMLKDRILKLIIQSKDVIEPTRIHAGCIAEFESIWIDHAETVSMIQNELCSEETMISQYWERARTTSRSKELNRTNTLLDINKVLRINKNCKEIKDKFSKYSHGATEWYKNYFNIEEDIYDSDVESLSLLKYESGEEFKSHYDGNTVSGRSISPILYLNDDYDGGEIEFIHHNITLKPKAGTLYLFPSNYAYAHAAHPIKSGTKYSIVTFFHDRADQFYNL